MRIHSVPLAILVSISGAALYAQISNPVRALVEGDIVNAATSAPLSGARVKLERSQAEDPIYGKVDRQGHFTFRNLDPGFYQLVVDAPGFRPSQISVDAQSQIPQPKVSKTIDGDGTIHASVSAPMQGYVSIEGKITDPYGDPMPGAIVEIFKLPPPPSEGEARPATAANVIATIVADSRGEFRAARLLPGTYWVLANKSDISHWTWQGTYRPTYYPAALDLASARPLKPEAGQQVRADIQVLRRAGVSVSGHLLGVPASGSPWPPVTALRLEPVTSEAFIPDWPFVQAKREFEFKDVLPGKYTLYAETDDPLSDPGNPVNRRPLLGLVKEVEIGQEDVTGLDLALEPVKSLSGSVEIVGDCTAAPRFVQLLSRHPPSPEPARAPIAADGTFEVQNVPVGRYDISLSSVEQPYNRIPLASATKGARDVLKNGLESPWRDDDILKITVACSGQGVRK